MPALKYRSTGLMQTSSMADIAFLMLTFFMVTTTVQEEKGLTLLLPTLNQSEPPRPIHDRNLFKVQLNSNDEIMVEGERRASLTGLRDEVKRFVMNPDHVGHLSEAPAHAIVSLKTDRNTSYKAYIATLDEIQAAYYELYAEQAGITPEAFRKLDASIPRQRMLYEKGTQHIPMNISIASQE